MWKKIISCALVASSLASASVCEADVSALRLGQPAPYDGLLIKPADAASIMADRKSLPDLIAVETKKTREEEQAKCKLNLDQKDIAAKEGSLVLSAQVKDLMNSNSALSKQLDSAQNSAKWTPVYVIGAAVAGLAAGVFTTVVVTKATR